MRKDEVSGGLGAETEFGRTFLFPGCSCGRGCIIVIIVLIVVPVVHLDLESLLFNRRHKVKESSESENEEVVEEWQWRRWRCNFDLVEEWPEGRGVGVGGSERQEEGVG